MTVMLLLLTCLVGLSSGLRTQPQQDMVKFGVREYETYLAPSDFRPLATNNFAAPQNLKMDQLLYQHQFFEGDIMGITKDTIDSFIEDSNANDMVSDFYRQRGDVLRYQAIRDESRLWEGGVIPFTISSLYTPSARAVIANAIARYTNRTCIKFVPRVSQRDYVFVSPAGGGCSSFVGRQRGKQRIQLGGDCLGQIGIVLHELMHAVGFFHEQSRADRNNYIRVNWGNISEVWNSNFRQYRLNYISHLGAPYDYGSIMHYGPYAFSKNGKKSIEALDSISGQNIGQRKRLSKIDRMKINRLYGCSLEPPEPKIEKPIELVRVTKPIPPVTTPAFPTDPTPLPTTRATVRPTLPTDPTPPTTTMERNMVLYHPFECYVRSDDGKMMFWPEKGYPRSHYRCHIQNNPRAWRGYSYSLERMNCLWMHRGRQCEVQSGESRLCWGRFVMACPSESGLPTDVRP